MLHVTASARAELQRFHKEEIFEGEFIRITRAYQCGGPRFELVVDDARSNMDETIEYDGFQIVIDQACLKLLADCTLEFDQNGFLFMDTLQNQC